MQAALAELPEDFQFKMRQDSEKQIKVRKVREGEKRLYLFTTHLSFVCLDMILPSYKEHEFQDREADLETIGKLRSRQQKNI